MNNVNRSGRAAVWIAAVVAAAVLAAGGWWYFRGSAGGLDLGIQLATDPAVVLMGEPFTLSVTVANDSGSALQGASISLVLPDDVVSADTPAQRVVSQPLGGVSSGGVSHQDFHLVATGGENTVFHFTAQVSYAAAGSAAQFQSGGSLDVAVGQPAVSVNIIAPPNVFSGQDFPIAVNYHNNTGNAITGMSLAMQYPPAFSFAGASTSLATNGDSSWSLGTLPADTSGTIAISGNLVGPGSASYPIGAQLSESISGQNYPIANPSADVILAESPLALSLAVGNGANYVSSAGDSLDYTLTVTNNSTVAFENIIASAKLSGAMFDLATLQTGGSFSSINDTVTWNGASAPALLSLAPGQAATLTFHVRTRSAFPIRLPSDKNYTVSVHAVAASPTVPPGTTASTTLTVADLTTKLGGAIALAENGYAHEPAASGSGIVNTGPYPPKVDQATEYTVHWLVTNYATDAQNVTISAYLQSGATCTGATQVPASTTFSCNPANGEVMWQVPAIAATTGITDRPLEAVFQITDTPAVNQAGQDVTVLGAAALTATDAFTGQPLQSSVPALTTAMPSDTSIPPGVQRQVTP
ncbi:MAG TPA: hypothetical protein VMT81_00645 [Candidatus Paceibacterota bacterium]|nr:hypothetical protein [Candidatus Paceibacterota bacterium]